MEKRETDFVSGGISRILFYSGNEVDLSTIKSIYDINKLDLNKLYITGDVLGKKNKNFYKLSFYDFNSYIENQKEFDFYEKLFYGERLEDCKIAYIKCDGTITGFFKIENIYVNPIIEDTYEGHSYFKCKIYLNKDNTYISSFKPINNPFLSKFLIENLIPYKI